MVWDRSDESVLHRLLVMQLTTMLRCPECLNHYHDEDVLFIGQEDDLWILAAACSECQTQGLVFVIVQEQTKDTHRTCELTAEESEMFGRLPAISMDDVLDIHLALERFEDDPAILWEQRESP